MEQQEAQEAQETLPENHLEDPMEKWHKEWTPPAGYITLKKSKGICESAGVPFPGTLVRCQVLGQTVHTEKELPGGAFVEGSNWKLDVEGNKIYHPQFQSLPFQAAVFESDLEKACGLVVEEEQPPQEPAKEPTVEYVEVEGLPRGFDMYTCEGLVWQTQSNESPGVWGPMRTTMARAVADAWSFHTNHEWS